MPNYAYIHELSAGTGTENREGRSYTRRFSVNTNEIIFDANGVMQAVPIATPDPTDGTASVALPTIWNFFPSDPYSICDSVSPEQHPYNKFFWTVTVNYVPYEPWNHANPLSRWPRVSFPYQSYREIVIQDQSNNPIQNSAKWPFDPPLEEDFDYLCIDIVQNTATFSPASAWDFKNSVNSAQITVAGVTIPIGVGWLREFTGSTQTWRGTNYYEVHQRIVLSDRPWLWKRRVLDQGVYDKNGKHITDGYGVPVVVPWNLDGSGLPLAPNVQGVYLSDFVTKKQRVWSGIAPALPATAFPP